MPLTVPAHQSLVLPLKLRWPRHLDGVALCIGSAAPDLAYPLGAWLNANSHNAVGIVTWSIPVTVVFTVLLRRRAAGSVLAQLPDLGPIRLRSYRVIGQRRSPLHQTVVGAAIGAGSHVLVDGFTHIDRFGSRWLGMGGVGVDLPIIGPLTSAKLLQYLGHSLGSIAAVLLLVHIGRSRLMERWYGAGAVAEARIVSIAPWRRTLFWAVALGPPLAVVALDDPLRPSVVFPAGTALAFSLLAAGLLPLRIDGSSAGDYSS